MSRLPRGWTRLKIIGEVEPVHILVHKETGKFGTMLNEPGNRDEGIPHQWPTLAAAEAHVREINEAQAIEGLFHKSDYNQGPGTFVTVRVKRVAWGWVHMDGTRVHGDVYKVDPAQLAAFEAKAAEHEALKHQMIATRDEAWAIMHRMQKLEETP